MPTTKITYSCLQQRQQINIYKNDNELLSAMARTNSCLLQREQANVGNDDDNIKSAEIKTTLSLQ